MSNPYKIPKRIHFMWVTSEFEPLEAIKPYGSNMFEYDSPHDAHRPLNYFHNIQKILEHYSNWEVNIWTRDASLIPATVKALEGTKVNIREFGPLLEEVGLGAELISDIDIFFQDPKFSLGDIIDLYKYAVAYTEGGLVTDLNFAAQDSFPDVILRDKEGFIISSENSFFGTMPRHQLMKLMISEFKMDDSDSDWGSDYFQLFMTEAAKYTHEPNKTFEYLFKHAFHNYICYKVSSDCCQKLGTKTGEGSWYKDRSQSAYEVQTEYQKLTMDFLDFITPAQSAGICEVLESEF